mmetsp:Transcript_36722/g.105892  ORF Transcript_36722/g.105892 Transcript_36722/m.105892 type:complete len:235 (-) Transcript_36722:826-1530(-)
MPRGEPRDDLEVLAEKQQARELHPHGAVVVGACASVDAEKLAEQVPELFRHCDHLGLQQHARNAAVPLPRRLLLAVNRRGRRLRLRGAARSAADRLQKVVRRGMCHQHAFPSRRWWRRQARGLRTPAALHLVLLLPIRLEDGVDGPQLIHERLHRVDILGPTPPDEHVDHHHEVPLADKGQHRRAALATGVDGVCVAGDDAEALSAEVELRDGPDVRDAVLVDEVDVQDELAER